MGMYSDRPERPVPPTEVVQGCIMVRGTSKVAEVQCWLTTPDQAAYVPEWYKVFDVQPEGKVMVLAYSTQQRAEYAHAKLQEWQMRDTPEG